MHGLASHEPLLVNLLGHLAGAVIFAIFLVLLHRGRRHAPRSGRVTRAAAALALFWNSASLLSLSWPDLASPALPVAAMGALSLLPAFLLDLGLDGRPRAVVLAGYSLGVISALLHAAESALPHLPLHRSTLLLTAAGFALISLLGWLSDPRPARRRLAAMVLVLFSLTFAHFHEEGAQAAWPLELAFHHAGIPLCLFVLAQDYRFLLLDAFLRFLANLFLAGLFTFAAWKAAALAGWSSTVLAADPRHLALAASAACLLLILFAITRQHAQQILTRLVFRRAPLDATAAALRAARLDSENQFLDSAAPLIAAHFHAPSWHWAPSAPAPDPESAAIPLRPDRLLLLGPRPGGHRYLSEDLAELAQLAQLVAERLQHARESERARLLAQAELRALQSQIHPHFLFNALNTLYGIIPATAQGARQTVLNLADIFRYFLRHDDALIPLEEELAIVRAYLEIEQLRLGQNLRTELDIHPAALPLRIPVLSLEPLVENAVKHGIAAQPGGGLVRISAEISASTLIVAVSDSGPGFLPNARDGVGLDNVRRRLALCLGPSARLETSTAGGLTRTALHIPLDSAPLSPNTEN
jgi:hypothetical protein